MSKLVRHIENETSKNNYYRKVILTNKYLQLVYMSIKDEIGEEIHNNTTQFIKIEKGRGFCILGNKKIKIKKGDSIMIPPKTKHNVVNSSKTSSLKLYTLYSPPHHPRNRKQKNNPSLV